jgi:ADP-ribose pyrophosphatase YjhB (NUDIX family)
MVEGRRRAAVSIAIIASPPHGILFVERASHLRDHPGQIALPGGGVDPEDGDDLQRTALRELREEVGIEPERVTVLAQLPVVSQRRANNFDVAPFVVVVAPGPFTIDGTETAGMFTVPLATILSDGVRDGRVEYGGITIDSPVLDHEGRRVWGLTAHILRSFVARWNDESSDLRALVEARLSG